MSKSKKNKGTANSSGNFQQEPDIQQATNSVMDSGVTQPHAAKTEGQGKNSKKKK